MTTHRDRPGVRLSKPGHWGNIPFENETRATVFAEGDANGKPFTIEHENVTLKLPEFGS
jgi:hypothetical protein